MLQIKEEKKEEKTMAEVNEEEFEDDGFCDNVEYQGIEYSCYDDTAEASFFSSEELEEADSIIIPQTITDSESGKTFNVTGYVVTDGAYKNITFPSTLEYIQGETFSDMDEDILSNMQHNLGDNNKFIIKNGLIYQNEDFEDVFGEDKNVYTLKNVQLNRPKGSFAIPEGVKALARGVFANCDQLTEVIIPATVRHIDDDPFLGCSALKRVVVNASMARIKCYDDCGKRTSLRRFIPEGVELVYEPKLIVQPISTKFSYSQTCNVVNEERNVEEPKPIDEKAEQKRKKYLSERIRELEYKVEIEDKRIKVFTYSGVGCIIVGLLFNLFIIVGFLLLIVAFIKRNKNNDNKLQLKKCIKEREEIDKKLTK